MSTQAHSGQEATPQSVQIPSEQLPPGKTVEFEVSGQTRQVFSFPLTANQFVKLELRVKTNGLTFKIIEPPAGSATIQTDLESWSPLLPILILAKTTGTYRLEITLDKRFEMPSQYRLLLVETGEATGREIHQYEALKLLSLDADHPAPESQAAALKILENYKNASNHYQLAGDLSSESKILNTIGNGYYRFGQLAQARQYFEKSLESARKINEFELIGQALTNIGLTYQIEGNGAKALELFLQALELRQKAQNRQGEGETLANIAGIYRDKRQWDQALNTYHQSLQCFRETHDQVAEAMVLDRIGVIHFNLEQLETATDFFSQALTIKQRLKRSVGIAETLCHLARVATQQSEFQKALDLYEEALPLVSGTGHAQLQGSIYSSLGHLYFNIGDFRRAESVIQQALDINRQVKNKWQEGALRLKLGNALVEQRRYQEAVEQFTTALAINRELNNLYGEGTVLHNLAFVFDQLGKQDEALAHLEAALPLRRKSQDTLGELATLQNLAEIYFKQGKQQKAIEMAQHALDRWPKSSLPHDRALALNQLAYFRTENKEYAQAKPLFEEALQLVETIREKVRSPELRTVFFSQNQFIYHNYINLLIRLHSQDPQAGYDQLALHASERARARALLELLTESGAQIRRGADADLLKREQTIRQALAKKTEALIRQQSQSGSASKAKATLQSEIDALTAEYQQLQEQLRHTSPHYAALTHPRPLTAREIQAKIVSSDTALLEYALGPTRSFAWIVTPDSITTVELPKAAEIEQAARKAYKLLAQTADPNRDLKLAPDHQNTTSSQELDQALSELSRLILAPVIPRLDRKRLLIVPDGVLHYIPFGALTVQASGSKAEPLLTHFELVTLPSASALDVLRTQPPNRLPPSKNLLVVADPVFDVSDNRLLNRATGLPSPQPVEEKTDRSRKLRLENAKASVQAIGISGESAHIPRLPGTRREAESILKLVPKTKAAQAFDFAASRSFFDRPDLDQFRLLHIATHGFVNSEHPELSGLIFSMVDRQGNDQNGFLLVPDVFNLKLNADLVTLSACQSGLGKSIRGEGMVGLTQGFLYAGTSRVLVSLWSVSDQATAELMKQFYHGLLVEKLRPAEALRRAQLRLRQNEQWSSPYYWAAFQLTGEWK